MPAHLLLEVVDLMLKAVDTLPFERRFFTVLFGRFEL